jgi:glyoxylase-like metal-dependent hydrolase (beta-lactamase superfamily II)
MNGKPVNLPEYEIFAIRYATMARSARDNFLLRDVHDGPMPMDFFIWVVRASDRLIVVDTGFSEAAAAKRGRQYLCRPAEGLLALGIAPAQVSDVVITHLHYDHGGNVGLFERAAFHLQDAEMAYATGRQMGHRAANRFFEVQDVTGVVREVFAGRVRFHDGDAELAPGISLHRIPGHTPGMQVVRVHTRRGWVVLASDASHFYANFLDANPFPAVDDMGSMLAGFERLRALSSSENHIIPGHDPKVMQLYPRYGNGPIEIAALHLPPDVMQLREP